MKIRSIMRPRAVRKRRTIAGLSLGIALLIVVLTIHGCRSQPKEVGPAPLNQAMSHLQERPTWTQRPTLDLPPHPAEAFLKNWVIVLDPGHGGDGHRKGYKRGPTGVREAEVNLRVGLLLRELLQQAGAYVVMTRETDVDVPLSERPRIANNLKRPDGGIGADLFISLHHNASSTPETNYTSVWFHGPPDWAEPDLDVARYLTQSIARQLRTEVGQASPLMNDKQIYDSGFRVLRLAEMPAVLVEASFHSNPDEEQRLRDAEYNLREAYGIYVGLCEYAHGGRPSQSLPTATVEKDVIRIQTTLNDGLPGRWWGSNRSRTISSTVRMYLNAQPIDAAFDPTTRKVVAEVPLDRLLKGKMPSSVTAELRIHHANFFKHHNWPQRYELTVRPQKSGPPTLSIQPLMARRYQLAEK